MSALDSMMGTIIKAMGLDMDQVKAEFTNRIAMFESNVKILNETLISIKKDQEELRNSLEIVAQHILDMKYGIDRANRPGAPNFDHIVVETLKDNFPPQDAFGAFMTGEK